MADKGLDITKFTTERKIDLIIPPKRNKLQKMSASQIVLTRRIARLRILVERYMGRLKNTEF
jgi:DDE superfamily endonuclease